MPSYVGLDSAGCIGLFPQSVGNKRTSGNVFANGLTVDGWAGLGVREVEVYFRDIRGLRFETATFLACFWSLDVELSNLNP